MSLSLFFNYMITYLALTGLGLATLLFLLFVVRAIRSIVKRIEKLAFRREAGWHALSIYC